MNTLLVSQTILNPNVYERVQESKQPVTFQIQLAEEKTPANSPFKKYTAVIKDVSSTHKAITNNKAVQFHSNERGLSNPLFKHEEKMSLEPANKVRGLQGVYKTESQNRPQFPKEYFNEDILIRKREELLSKPRETKHEVPKNTPNGLRYTIAEQIKFGHSSFTLQGHVIRKSELKYFETEGGEDRARFSIILADLNKDIIEITYFGDLAERNFSRFQKGKRYQIENGEVKKTPSKYQERVAELQIYANKKTTAIELPNQSRQQRPREGNGEVLEKKNGLTIAEIKSRFKEGSQADVHAFIHSIKDLSYPGCPGIHCTKKATMISGGWKCDNCGTTFKNAKFRYLFKMELQDRTGILKVTSFDGCGESIMGMSANQLFSQRNPQGLIDGKRGTQGIFTLKRNKSEISSAEFRLINPKSTS